MAYSHFLWNVHPEEVTKCRTVSLETVMVNTVMRPVGRTGTQKMLRDHRSRWDCQRDWTEIRC